MEEIRMRITAIAMLGATLLASCSGARPRDAAPVALEARFACTNGEAIEVRFGPAHGVATLIRNDQAIELTQQPAASGFVYSNGPNTIRGKGDDLRVEIGRMTPLECKVAAP
jgi:membrane-bound inhibitor of C-type lysozyme